MGTEISHNLKGENITKMLQMLEMKREFCTKHSKKNVETLEPLKSAIEKPADQGRKVEIGIDFVEKKNKKINNTI